MSVLLPAQIPPTAVNGSPRWARFLSHASGDLLLFTALVVMLGLVRISFLVMLRANLGPDAMAELPKALFTGMRFDAKTSAMVASATLFFCTLPSLAIDLRFFHNLRLVVAATVSAIAAFLPFVRARYYEEFHDIYDENVFNFFRDDTGAVVQTLYKEGGLIAKLLFAALAGALAVHLFRSMFRKFAAVFMQPSRAAAKRAGFAILFPLFLVFCMYGRLKGDSLSGRDAAVTADAFLNKAILDDLTAFRFAYAGHRKLMRAKNIDVSAEVVRRAASELCPSGFDAGLSLDEACRRTARGPLLAKPRHIFLVVGESYAAWPLLPKYASLHLADGLKAIADATDAVSIPVFLPASSGTMTSLASILTGLADTGVFTNYQVESYKPYATSLAVQMKRLGYKPRLFYGGFPSWQRLDGFARAQGFESMYSAGNTGEKVGVWGVPDGRFLEGITRDFDDSLPSFNLVLTVTNHPPYTIDVAAEGFPWSKVAAELPADRANDEKFMTGLGHFWYSDRAIAAFIRAMRAKYPDSLFLITGDHAQRLNPEAEPPLDSSHRVPLVIWGRGLQRDWFPKENGGSHRNIAPTLFELIAERGFSYQSWEPSLTEPGVFGFQKNVWAGAGYVGYVAPFSRPAVPAAGAVTSTEAPNRDALARRYQNLQAVSWWRVRVGASIAATK